MNEFFKNNRLLYRYIFISIASYAFVFISLYLFIEILKINNQEAFCLAYALNYILLYVVQLKYLFRTKHDNKKLLKFIVYILSFYGLANVLFFLFSKLAIHYLLCTMLTVSILMPFRFLISKKIVFSD
ncbi:GtrA family protein [Zunongwangia atlantica]|uniref:GtrA/DPMS transmembrane domain-containing protein n=1 Tax=Zunongwangia atlantica 22II14-10F7 TaxID=1185767 RepID=A0A1Y1T1V3_9FLAO|nr:hypothetical protein IIF7_12830 [Zunongwangia atlantica 22II14-10F7]